MPTNPYYKIRMDQLRSSKDQWSTVKFALIGQLTELSILRSFFNTWKGSNGTFEADPNSKDFQDALSKLPKDDPNTPSTDESFSLQKLSDKFKSFFGSDILEKLYDGNTLNDEEAIKAINEELLASSQRIEREVRNLFGKQFLADSEINSIKSQIADLDQAMKSEANEEE